VRVARDRRRADKPGPPWCGCCEWSKTNLEDAGTKVLVPRTVEGSTWRVASGTSLQANHPDLEKQPLADFLVHAERSGRTDDLAVELKSKVGHVSGIVGQLKNALELITRSEYGHLSAVLAHKGKLGPNELRQLKTLQIAVKGKRVPIQHIKSGDSLKKVLH
jgi:hypothetical protein